MRTELNLKLTIDHECDDPELLRMAVTSELCNMTRHYQCTEMLPGTIPSRPKRGATSRCLFRISHTADEFGGTCNGGAGLPDKADES